MIRYHDNIFNQVLIRTRLDTGIHGYNEFILLVVGGVPTNNKVQSRDLDVTRVLEDMVLFFQW